MLCSETEKRVEISRVSNPEGPPPLPTSHRALSQCRGYVKAAPPASTRGERGEEDETPPPIMILRLGAPTAAMEPEGEMAATHPKRSASCCA